MFAVLDTRYAAMTTAESEAYIRDEPVVSDFTADPVHAKRNDLLARMGLDLDFVSAPATSVDVESCGSLTVSKHRHTQSDASTRVSVVLRSRVEAGLDNDAEVIKHINEKTRRVKNTGDSATNIEIAWLLLSSLSILLCHSIQESSNSQGTRT